MKELNQFPLARVLLFLIPGILLGEFFPGNRTVALGVIIVSLLSLLLWFWILNKRLSIRYHFVAGLFIAASFMAMGYYITAGKRAVPVDSQGKELIFVATVMESPVRKGVKTKVIAEVFLEDKKTPVLLMIQIRDTNNTIHLLPGDRIIVKSRISSLKFPVNPGGFDYNIFLRRKGICGMVYCDNHSVEKIIPTKRYRIKRAASCARRRLLHIIKARAPSEEIYAIAGALLIGYDDDLTKESRTEFSKAGAMHILCVSGLHVGVIFLILNYIMKGVFRRKQFRWLRYVLMLSGLWSYAFITGLSPSVMRATVMLTFVVTGNELERHTSVYNSISASALILLFFNPMLLFSIGFQLSYGAVISIIALHKPLVSIFTPQNVILRKCWEVMAVSIAAQIGTFALATYYFHSFPTLFLITNLVVIPLASMILYSGIIFLALSAVPVFSGIVSALFFFLIDVLQRFTGAVADVPVAAIENINLTGFHAMSIAIMVVVIIYVVYHGLYNRVRLVLTPVALLIMISVVQILAISSQQRVIIYSDYRNMVVEVLQGRSAIPLHNIANEELSFTTSDTHRKYGVKKYLNVMPDGYAGVGLQGATIQFFLLGGMRIATCEGSLSMDDLDDFPETDVLVFKGIRSTGVISALCKLAGSVIITTNEYDHRKVMRVVDSEEKQILCTALDGACVLSAFYLPGGRCVTSIKTGR